MKTCTKCGALKPLDQFGSVPQRKDGRHSWCKQCLSAAASAFYKANPHLRFNDDLRGIDSQLRHVRRYGIEPAEYIALGETQQWRCALCGGESAKGFRLDLDHCHDTKRIRGLLCRSCNIGIGMFKHDIALLAKAIQYLS